MLSANSQGYFRGQLIGDKLASHFFPQVVSLALQCDIYFTSLPPNSTNFMKPLDVAVIGPMKQAWRAVWADWRKETRLKGDFAKDHFPALLKRLHSAINDTIGSNLVSGFRTCGIFPRDRQKPLQKLPSTKGRKAVVESDKSG